MGKANKKFIPPFYYIAIGLNKNNEGPETRPEEIVKTSHEVWDSACQTVAKCDSEAQAKAALKAIREEYKDQPLLDAS